MLFTILWPSGVRNCTWGRNVDSNVCPGQEFEPRTSHLAVQQAAVDFFCSYCLLFQFYYFFGANNKLATVVRQDILL